VHVPHLAHRRGDVLNKTRRRSFGAADTF
jgi:hypothetical protein